MDDDRAVLRIFTQILNRSGYDVDNAQSGKEAIAKLRDSSYDAALVDIRLPDMDGTDLLMKMPEKAANMVKIVISGSPTSEYRQKAAENGANVFLEKPIKPEELLAVIAAKLKENRNLDAGSSQNGT